VLWGLIALLSVAPGLFLLGLLHPEIWDARTRTYKRFFADIEVGMSRTEVNQAFQRRYPPKDARNAPRIATDDGQMLWFFMYPEREKDGDCEGIFLTFEKGRVAKKQYSAD
jgi:hypothetical protein